MSPARNAAHNSVENSSFCEDRSVSSVVNGARGDSIKARMCLLGAEEVIRIVEVGGLYEPLLSVTETPINVFGAE